MAQINLYETSLRALTSLIRTNNWLASELSAPTVVADCTGMDFFFRVATGLRATSLPEHRGVLSWLGYRIEKEQTAL